MTATACGASPSGAASAGSGTGTSTGANLPLKFAQCMRAHGVPKFPDPSGGQIRLGGAGINPGAPAFQTAQRRCAKYSPKGGPVHGAPTAAEKAAALKFSECMRAHGVSSFPDPTYGSPPSRPPTSGAFLLIRGAGYEVPSALDPRSPVFQRAARACGLGPRRGAKETPVP